MNQPSMHEAALGYLLAHQAEHLSGDRQQLLNRCADHLQHRHACTTHRAMVTAAQALGELESRGNAAHLDISASTSFVVFMRDPATGASYAFTAAELLSIGRSHASAMRALH